MARLNEREIQRSVELQGVEKTGEWIVEGLKKGEIKAGDVSFRQLFENTVVNKSDNKSCGREIISNMLNGRIQESGMATAVDTSTFQNISGQIFYNAVLEASMLPAFAVSAEFGVVNSQILNTKEKFAGVGNLGDVSKVIPEGSEFPRASLAEDWINSPVQLKNGIIIPVTREAVINDRVGMVLEHARMVGEALGLAREIAAVDAIINSAGASATVNYNWRNNDYAVWQTSAAASPFYDNVVGSNTLVDYGSLNNAEIALANIIDPITGQPMVSNGPYTLLVTPENRYTAERILATLQYRTGTAAANNSVMITGNLAPAPFQVISSKYLKTRLEAAGQATSHWYFGDIRKAFKFVRALDISVVEANPQSGLAFNHDILFQYKAVKIETPAVFQPRVMTKNTVAA